MDVSQVGHIHSHEDHPPHIHFPKLEEVKPLDNDQIEAMNAEVAEQIEADQLDPATQQYFMRLDRKTVVKTEEEYFALASTGVGMKVISYGHAVALIANERAGERKLKKVRAKNKVARKSRKRNAR